MGSPLLSVLVSDAYILKKNKRFGCFCLLRGLKGDASYCNCAEGESTAVVFQVLSPGLHLLTLNWQIR